MNSSAAIDDDDFDVDSIDRMLLHRISNGDRDALGRLYCSYHGRLCRFLSRLTQRTDVIDEIITDCFWIACRNPDSFNGDSRVSTWLMGIAYQCGLRALRLHDDEPAKEEAMRRPSVHIDSSEEDRELHDWLINGLDHLSIDQKVAIELVYGEGYSLEDVAVIMLCSVGTVKAHLLHARIKLCNVMPT